MVSFQTWWTSSGTSSSIWTRVSFGSQVSGLCVGSSATIWQTVWKEEGEEKKKIRPGKKVWKSDTDVASRLSAFEIRWLRMSICSTLAFFFRILLLLLPSLVVYICEFWHLYSQSSNNDNHSGDNQSSFRTEFGSSFNQLKQYLPIGIHQNTKIEVELRGVHVNSK